MPFQLTTEKFNTPQHTFVPVPRQYLDFQCHMSWSFLRWETVHFFIYWWHCWPLLFKKFSHNIFVFDDYCEFDLWYHRIPSYMYNFTQQILPAIVVICNISPKVMSIDSPWKYILYKTNYYMDSILANNKVFLHSMFGPVLDIYISKHL